MYRSGLHNEQDILARLVAGDQEAFEAVYRNRYLAIFHYVRRLVADQQAAEDITTDTFLKCWQRREAFGGASDPGKIDAFLFTVAHNSTLNYLRDEKRHRVKEKEVVAGQEDALQPDWDEQEVAVRVYEYIYAEIAKLPANMQAVLRLHLEGRKNEAIAAELGLAEKTVRNLKTEAIRLLRLRLTATEFAALQILLLLGSPAFC